MIRYITRERYITEESLISERKHIDMLNEHLGHVDLTLSQEKTLQWLAGFETSTVKNIISAFIRAEKERPRSFNELTSEQQIAYWEQCKRERETENERW